MGEQSKNTFFYVTGSKGGVGKSFVANALIFSLIERGKAVYIIDTDDSNPDVGKIYEKFLPVEYLSLTDDIKSWGIFLNKLESIALKEKEKGQINVVVNGAARDNKAIEHNGDLLNGVFEEGLGYEFTTLWVMSNAVESVELLKAYLNTVKVGTIFALRNLHFGVPDDFIEFNQTYQAHGSVFKKKIHGIYDFPVMESSLATQIHREKLILTEVRKNLQIGSRMIFDRWLNKTRDIFSRISNRLAEIENVSVSADSEQGVKPL
jgi:hypothetical protein